MQICLVTAAEAASAQMHSSVCYTPFSIPKATIILHYECDDSLLFCTLTDSDAIILMRHFMTNYYSIHIAATIWKCVDRAKRMNVRCAWECKSSYKFITRLLLFIPIFKLIVSNDIVKSMWTSVSIFYAGGMSGVMGGWSYF